MKRKVVISERAVRSKMGALNIRSLSQLSEELTKKVGLGKNTIYDIVGSSFYSGTLDALMEFFGCDAGELIEVVVEPNGDNTNGDAHNNQVSAPVGVVAGMAK